MPRKLVKKEFELRFGKIPFHFNENACHHFAKTNFDDLLYSDPDSLARETALASYKIPGMRPMAKLFRVSVLAMAIRLKELGFVKYP